MNVALPEGPRWNVNHDPRPRSTSPTTVSTAGQRVWRPSTQSDPYVSGPARESSPHRHVLHHDPDAPEDKSSAPQTGTSVA